MTIFGEIRPESKLTICTTVSESHPTADQCIDSKNVEQSQTVGFISPGLLRTSSTVWWQPFPRLHGHLPTCGDSLSVGSMVISQRVVTAFPSAPDHLWTQGFDKTGHLVFPRFNILPRCDGSLSAGSRVTSPGLTFFHGVIAAFPSAP